MEVRTYRVPRIGSGTMADPYRPKYLDDVEACGHSHDVPCAVLHASTCERIGTTGDGKPIMQDLPTTAWSVTFRCHADLWSKIDADPSCTLRQKHVCDCDMEAVWRAAAPDRAALSDALGFRNQALVMGAKRALDDVMAPFVYAEQKHIAEARALVGMT